MRSTVATIDLEKFAKNVASVRGIVNDSQIMAVVKANAYGHGAVECARVALECGVEFLGVAIVEEGVELRDAGICAQILVLGSSRESIFEAVAAKLTLTVYDSDAIYEIDGESYKQNTVTNIHIKIDTGMGRIGVKTLQEVEALLFAIHQCKNVQLQGVFTHFACSDWQDKSYTHAQAKLFDELLQVIKKQFPNVLAHAANSGAVLDLPQYHYDIVRAGIVLYGCYPSKYVNMDVQLLPVMSISAPITYLKKMEKGQFISYNSTFCTQRQSLIATIPIGYGDGYIRAFSNKAQVLIRGKRAKIVGTVCMDQLMVDVTDILDVTLGDRAVLLGEQEGDCITAQELADIANTISYEVLLNISQRVPRIYKGR